MLTSDESDELSARHWDTLHAMQRFRPQFPNDHVVRFLLGTFPEQSRTSLHALDVGVGGGRHTKLLCELGFQTSGIDISQEGLKHCQAWLHSLGFTAELRHASMFNLPFPDSHFDLALSFGVAYYADEAGVNQTVRELHRILKPGGWAFLLMRSAGDYRFGKGARLAGNTFQLEIADTNELGTVQTFLDERGVSELFSSFSALSFEKSETTFSERKCLNSDWLIKVQK